MLQRLDHPNVVKHVEEFVHDGKHLCIVMELAGGGNLKE